MLSKQAFAPPANHPMRLLSFWWIVRLYDIQLAMSRRANIHIHTAIVYTIENNRQNSNGRSHCNSHEPKFPFNKHFSNMNRTHWQWASFNGERQKKTRWNLWQNTQFPRIFMIVYYTMILFQAGVSNKSVRILFCFFFLNYCIFIIPANDACKLLLLYIILPLCVL